MARKIVVVVEGAAGESVKADAADGSDGTAASGNRVEMVLMTSPSLQDSTHQLCFLRARESSLAGSDEERRKRKEASLPQVRRLLQAHRIHERGRTLWGR
jgi:hypothetical protein